MSPPRRTIKSFAFITDLLENILHGNHPGATVIVCWTEEEFIQQLLASIQLQLPAREPSLQESGEAHAQTQPLPGRHLSHSLLSNTINILDKSQKVTLSFCPSLEHLRAYLGASSQWPVSRQRANQICGPSARELLAIVNPVSLHMHTSSFSAQGISRTLALAVEIAAWKDMDLVLYDCRDLSLESEEIPSSGSIWDTSVPLFNATTRSVRQEEVSAVPTVQIKKLARKWFQFPVENDASDVNETVQLA